MSLSKIAVLGGGSVGSTLAKALASSGKAASVVIAARDKDKTNAKLRELGIFDIVQAEAADTALQGADIIILATPGLYDDRGIQDFAKSLGDVAGKVVLDATNPLSEFQDGLQIRWREGISGGEILANCLPDAHVYKAFNTVGVEHMADPKGKDMLFCGPEESKAVAAAVIEAVGFQRAIYVGPIRYARNLEAIAELWIHCGVPPLPGKYMGRDWTFSIAGNPEL